MNSLAEIESATKRLPPAEQRKLVRVLSTNLQAVSRRKAHAAGKHVGADYLLAASADAPAMTPELVKKILEEFP